MRVYEYMHTPVHRYIMYIHGHAYIPLKTEYFLEKMNMKINIDFSPTSKNGVGGGNCTQTARVFLSLVLTFII